MVVAMPRSGTAWTANLLTIPGVSICRHEALADSTPDDLIEEGAAMKEKFGICDTSLVNYLDLHEIDTPKLVIHRAIRDVNKSAAKAGLPEADPAWAETLHQTLGYHIKFEELFDADEMDRAQRWLIGVPLDRKRHAELCRLNIQNTALMERVTWLLAAKAEMGEN